jgi:hypothetical protein
MTKKEMREYAAKAAGYSGLPSFKWNPLKSDGDCARMEAALEIDVLWTRLAVGTEKNGEPGPVACYTDHNGDSRWCYFPTLL